MFACLKGHAAMAALLAAHRRAINPMRIAFVYKLKLWQRLDYAHQLRRAGLAAPFSLSRLRAVEAKVAGTMNGGRVAPRL